MDLYSIILLLYLIVLIICVIIWLRCKNIDRAVIVKSSIELMVMINQHFTDSEKLRLLVAQINDIDFKKIPEWEIEIFKEIIENKYTK